MFSFQAVVLFVVEHGYSDEKYELVTTFPRRKLSSMDLEQTLVDLNIPQQETIFIQER